MVFQVVFGASPVFSDIVIGHLVNGSSLFPFCPSSFFVPYVYHFDSIGTYVVLVSSSLYSWLVLCLLPTSLLVSPLLLPPGSEVVLELHGAKSGAE